MIICGNENVKGTMNVVLYSTNDANDENIRE